MDIQVNDVFYSYDAGSSGTHEDVLKNIRLTLRGNRTIAVVGKTGSGKSTFAQLLNGLLRPTRGTVDIGGIKIGHGRKGAVAFDKVGIVFQFPEHQLFEDTVMKDVSFGPRNLGLPQAEAERKALEAMRQVGLEPALRDRSPHELSGGEQRRVAVAGVLAMDPAVLVLDEPTAGLDPAGKQALWTCLQAWREERERTLIVVTHDMELVAEHADEVVVLDGGEARLHTDPRTLFTVYRNELREYGLKLPAAVRFLEALNAKLEKPMNIQSVRKEDIMRQVADYFREGGA